MNGMLAKKMQGEQPAAGQAEQPAQQPAQKQPDARAEGSNEASPEEQEAFERTVLAGMKAIHGETHDQIMKMLKSGADQPAQTLAEVSKLVMVQLDEQSGRKIPEEVILPASEQILTMVAELAKKSGVMQVDQQVVGQATQQMVMGLAEAYGADPEEAQEVIQSMGQDEIKSIVDEQSQYDTGLLSQRMQQNQQEV